MNAVLSDLACYHCGLPAPAANGLDVVIEGVSRPMCCPGCAAVATSIVESGLESYYRSRTEFASSAAAAALVPPELALYDRQPGLATPAAETGLCSADFSVDGIRCAACVWLIERGLGRMDGVRAVDMNVARARLHVEWDPRACKPSDLLRTLAALGYSAQPYDPGLHGQQMDQARKQQFRRLFIAGLCMMQVMMYAFPAYVAEDGTLDASMASLMNWAALILTLPAVLYSAWPFYQGAWAGLRAGMPGMDVPVALGILAAFGASVVATVSGQGEVWYDSVTMFVFLLLGSRHLELMARRKAARAMEQLRGGVPESARRLAAYPARRDTEVVAASDLQVGDHVLVPAGSPIAADGVIVEGDSTLDLSLLTGESQAQARECGDEVPGGAINLAQPLVVKVLRPAGESTLSRLVQLAGQAGRGKPRLAQWADQVATWFVAGLLGLTLVVLLAWYAVDAGRAWQVAVALLVVSCPCALSLATPTALAAATDGLVRRGVLPVGGHVLETLARATHVVFDKTGTLTEGRPVLEAVDVLGQRGRDECVRMAAALEAGSRHPLARAITDAAPAGVAAAHAVRETAGQGIEGEIDGQRYRIGRAAFAGALAGVQPLAEGEADGTLVYLSTAGHLLARFTIADGLRPEAAQVIDDFKAAGKRVILLSGDSQALTLRVANRLGIEDARGDCLPDDKLAFVKALQAEGKVVAMVGDGVNDAAVLGAADVSFAMGSGAALAQLHADCVLYSGRLGAMLDVARSARRTMRIMHQNLGWAMLYNLTAIPAAALGLLSPWLSAVGMSVSSAVVVLNALRARRAGS